ncbi:type II toxin-antitoxin system RelE/ParE family toxin [Desulfoscipio geothermicus]|uniref:Plasmid stabilization system protein ParE n=1 Tax=Desulfoscipio geothermicus DSM 3669 TaxID=1121426 RepID=A0A1I6DRR0_9FIRM|nr:type II toxin-antitoxin system RelE/ParE family toxin [Desulfoscipio geothermicus]SFR08126.1 Plasmid stabilization system protein ParE [Desulfoscipio geothermicus DSM 3669]
MPKHLISITEAAEQDLAEIVDYISNDNPAAALKLAENIEQSILQLEDFPLIGAIPKNRRLTRQGYRILIVDSYLVFYVSDFTFFIIVQPFKFNLSTPGTMLTSGSKKINIYGSLKQALKGRASRQKATQEREYPWL